ncbi:TrbC/VirB2 family protein [Ramlibacter sp. AN1133]|uniref:TrbC/VirB2 family protein n=1 Tax=Ramlibacter sp. AN1133 TaxID=3133429 RepID=UPI0030BEC7DD
MRSSRPSFRSTATGPLRTPAAAALLAVFALVTAFALMPGPAYAQQIQVPFVQEFGCSVVQWLKGPLAILIFILVCVATLVIGMITKMDWARIITVCVLFGLVVSSGAVLASSSFVQNVPGFSACLQ